MYSTKELASFYLVSRIKTRKKNLCIYEVPLQILHVALAKFVWFCSCAHFLLKWLSTGAWFVVAC